MVERYIPRGELINFRKPSTSKVYTVLTKLTQQQDELQQQTDLSNRISSLTFNRHLIRTTSEATQHSTEVAIDSTREKSEDVETSTEDAADSTITEDITAYTTTGSTTHKNKNLRTTDMSHRQLTQNKFAALADTQIIMRGTAIRENQQTNINKSLTKQHQKTKSHASMMTHHRKHKRLKKME